MHLLEHGPAEAVPLVLGKHTDGLHVSGIGDHHGAAIADSEPGIFPIGEVPFGNGLRVITHRVLRGDLQQVVRAGRVGDFRQEHVDVPGVGGE